MTTRPTDTRLTVRRTAAHAGAPRARLQGLDLARALALVGMVVVNFNIAMGVTDGFSLLDAPVEALSGRAAATFVVLAGIGLSLMTARVRKAGDRAGFRVARNNLWRRAAVLFAFGALTTPIWPADILHFYGVYLLIAAPCLVLRSSWLIGAMVALIVAFVILLFALDYEAGWNFETLDYHGMWTVTGAFRHIFFNGFHPVVPWLAFVFFGVLIGRIEFTQAHVQKRMVAWGLGVTILAELTRYALVVATADTPELQPLFGSEPMPPTPLYMLSGGATATAVIGACLTISARQYTTLWMRALVHTGQLALTLYIAHVFIGLGTLEALGLLGDQSRALAITASGVFCVLACGAATLWRAHYSEGPAEWLMRRITATQKTSANSRDAGA